MFHNTSFFIGKYWLNYIHMSLISRPYKFQMVINIEFQIVFLHLKWLANYLLNTECNLTKNRNKVTIASIDKMDIVKTIQ